MTVIVEDRIKEIVEEKGTSLLWLAEQIGMTKQGFYYTLNNKTIKVETLQKISDVLQVPLNDFFISNDEVKARKNNILKESFADFITYIALLWGVYTYINNLDKLIKRAKEDNDFAKNDLVLELEKTLKEILKIIDEMNEANLLNDFQFPKPNQ